MPDTPLISAVPDGRDHALEIARDFIATKDEGAIAPYVRGLTDFTAEQSFAIMQGSGNEMPLFEQYVALLRRHGYVSADEALDVLLEQHSSPARSV